MIQIVTVRAATASDVLEDLPPDTYKVPATNVATSLGLPQIGQGTLRVHAPSGVNRQYEWVPASSGGQFWVGRTTSGVTTWMQVGG